MHKMPDLVCWKCGAELGHFTLPIGRRDVCPECSAELHVCTMCVDFDPNVAQQCREPTVEEVTDKTLANFCDLFSPKPSAFAPTSVTAQEQALSRLDELFGGTSSDSTMSTDDVSTDSRDPNENQPPATDKNAQARAELEQLFGNLPAKHD